ncbi:type II secretion system GspH family protein [Patescibacteria group bacterium]|nr:type II secretion system GspH family protein [Patescibacteria group bacterium]
MRTTAQKIQRGFTLIELLIVIGILAILLAITLIAINPQRQFQMANDTQRKSDVNAVLNAISQYVTEHNGQLPAGITATSSAISAAGADLCTTLAPTYIADLPVDPIAGVKADATKPCTDAANNAYVTGYTVSANNNRVTVSAVGEITTDISVTR